MLRLVRSQLGVLTMEKCRLQLQGSKIKALEVNSFQKWLTAALKIAILRVHGPPRMEQRKIYCRGEQGEWLAHAQNPPNSPLVFREVFIGKFGRGAAEHLRAGERLARAPDGRERPVVVAVRVREGAGHRDDTLISILYWISPSQVPF